MNEILYKNTANSRINVVVVMPAYNASRTLEATYRAIPVGIVNQVILVDDCSRDDTVAIAQSLKIKVFRHQRNLGYGANQKTCYCEALKTNNEIVVMLHPDYQYDPSLLSNLIQPIVENKADVVFGSRLLRNNPIKQGMPWWKYMANIMLTYLENLVFGLRLSEYHTGYRAYSRKVLEAVNFKKNSDSFIFDQEIIAQMVLIKSTIHEVSVPARYFPEASSADFKQSVIYGFSILRLLICFLLYKHGLKKDTRFERLY